MMRLTWGPAILLLLLCAQCTGAAARKGKKKNWIKSLGLQHKPSEKVVGMAELFQTELKETMQQKPEPILTMEDQDGESTSEWPDLQDGTSVFSPKERKKKLMRIELAKKLYLYWRDGYPKLKSLKAPWSRFPTKPRPPHLENCERIRKIERNLDVRKGDGSRPRWSLLGGSQALGFSGVNETVEEQILGEGSTEEDTLKQSQGRGLMGPFPPWITGSDEELLPLTRRVQRDIWIQQHPKDCNAPGVRFLVVDIRDDFGGPNHTVPIHLGIGAQFMALSCLLGRAIREKRVLIIRSYDRAKTDVCKGNSWGLWSCFFAAETSEQCRKRAFQLMENPLNAANPDENEDPLVLVWDTEPYTYWDESPSNWGTPWEMIQPTVVYEGKRIQKTPDDSHRWFRAQAVRYFTRFPSQVLCHATNRVRHGAFGVKAALLVASAMVIAGQTEIPVNNSASAPLLPYWEHQPLYQGGGKIISVHVRQGDKSKEMVIKNFTDHMKLASHIRMRFPEATSIWLTTEMQSVINETRDYPDWSFYYTKFPRQAKPVGNGQYESIVGLGWSTLNALVNFRIAAACDFFVGTMGSTSSLIVDDLRRTSGKESTGLLTVNRDRAWLTQEERDALGLWFH